MHANLTADHQRHQHIQHRATSNADAHCQRDVPLGLTDSSEQQPSSQSPVTISKRHRVLAVQPLSTLLMTSTSESWQGFVLDDKGHHFPPQMRATQVGT